MDRSKILRTLVLLMGTSVFFIVFYSTSTVLRDGVDFPMAREKTINDGQYYHRRSTRASKSVPSSSSIIGTSTSRPSYRRRNSQQQQTTKHVTKSLAELGSTPSTNQDLLFFNRVPKSGSEMLVLLMTWLQGQNGFKHFRLPGGRKNNDRRLERLFQETMIEEVKELSRSSAVPSSFDRHVYFTNFSSFGTQNPIYINLIRDPIDKMMSRFYYADLERRRNPEMFEECVVYSEPDCELTSGHSYDLTIPYFCGHEVWCSMLNNHWALEKAKFNVEKYFEVVGVLEHLNETLAVLESRVPRYFSGVQNLYFHELLEPHHNKNKNNPREIQPSTRRQLEASLNLEYEFYRFIKSRLLRQYDKPILINSKYHDS